MRGAISKSGGNASLAGGVNKVNHKRARNWKRRRQPRGRTYIYACRKTTGGQGVHREVESEGFAEKYRAVVDGAILWRTGRPKVGQGRACTMEAKAFSFTHRTKVFADGTVWKISVWPQEDSYGSRVALG